MSPFTYVGDHDPSESVQLAHFHLITSIDLITNEKHRIMRISWNGSARSKLVRRVIANCGRLRKGYCPNAMPSKVQLWKHSDANARQRLLIAICSPSSDNLF
jgi:hypothetical protein